MSFELKLAWRYFTSRRKNLVRFTSFVALLGIASGVASLIIAQAVAKGFRDEIQDKVLSNTAHILVSDIGESRISNSGIIEQKIREIEGIERVEPTSFESAVVSSATKSSHGVLRVKDWKQARALKTEKDETSIRVAVGKELASVLGIKVGDKFDLVTFEKEETPRKTEVSAGEIFETGLFEFDSAWIYVAEEDYRGLRDIEVFSPSVYSVFVQDIYDTDRITGELQKVLGESFKVVDWQEANKPLFSALSLERKVTLAIISLIIFIASLNITTTLSLLVNERRYDIGVLKTFGANRKSIVSIFLFEGLILSVLGIVAGVVLGLTACYTGNYFRVISLPQEVYSLNFVPFNVSAGSVLQIAIIAFFLCLAAIIYPAIKAGKVKPIENLKTR